MSHPVPPGNLVIPILPRTGLGHAMGTYARAFVYFSRGDAAFVHPFWFKIRIGPYIRREADKRNYHRIVRVPSDWGMAPWNAIRRLWMRVVSEDEFDPAIDGQFLLVRDEDPLHPRTLGNMAFVDPHRAAFVKALRSISKAPIRDKTSGSSTIGVFHRSGDVRTLRPNSKDPRTLRTHGFGYYPPEYAAEALRKVREIAGWKVPAVLSTDAEPSEVGPILNEGSVEISRTRSALANMLEMSQHDVLVMGTSSYAKWSWFLGDALAVVPRYQDRVENLIRVPHRQFAWFVFDHETSLNETAVQRLFADRLRNRSQGR